MKGSGGPVLPTNSSKKNSTSSPIKTSSVRPILIEVTPEESGPTSLDTPNGALSDGHPGRTSLDKCLSPSNLSPTHRRSPTSGAPPLLPLSPKSGSWVNDSNNNSGGRKEQFNDNESMHSSISAITPRIEDNKTATLTFRDLSYRVRLGGGKEREILKGVCGVAQTGRLVAIMGPSGAGKTCLLNALADRLPVTSHGALSGEILVNGLARADNFKQMVGFVTQDDVFFSNITVVETLRFAAKLKLQQTDDPEVERIVEAVLDELSLTPAANTRIGNAFVRGVSGGERKRVNIGVSLISTIPILFLDEPTTNLDAFQAMNVMNTLRAVARNGRTVISTIHQPRSSIYQLFDDLFLLSEGHVMYFGPACDAVAYFSGLHFRCPEFYNPADFFMDLIAVDRRTPALLSESMARVDNLALDFQKSPGWAEALLRHEGLKSKPGNDVSKFYQGYMATFWRQLQLLSRRSFHQILRDTITLRINLFMNIFFGLVIGFLYFQMGYSQTNISDRRGLVFFVIVHCSFGLVGQVQNAFTVEKTVVAHEREARLYRVSSYYIAKALSEIPVRAFMPLLYSVLVYWIAGLKQDFATFVVFVIILVAVVLYGTSMGLLISAISPSFAVSLALGPTALNVAILFGGFYANRGTIPPALRWIEWFSYIRYAYESLAINEFSGSHFSCPASNTTSITSTTTSTMNFACSCSSMNPSLNESCAIPIPVVATTITTAPSPACTRFGEDVLRQMQLETSTGVLWRNVGILLLFTVFCHGAAYWSLRKRSEKKRLMLPSEIHSPRHSPVLRSFVLSPRRDPSNQPRHMSVLELAH